MILVNRVRLVVAVAVLAFVAVSLYLVQRDPTIRVVAHFPSAKGIYVGDDVTVLGVTVGSITRITPSAGDVEIEMEVSSDEPLAADVKAAQVAQSLISVRAIALGPRYTGGPRLADGATIPISRTTVPVEWDEVKDQLVRLSAALGPDGEKEGALGDLVESGAGFLDGQGSNLNATIDQLSQALTTLSDNRGELFATVRNLQVFVSALESSDAQVRTFTTRLDDVASVLDEDREQIGSALASMSRAFGTVQEFLKDNKDVTASTLEELASSTSVLGENPQDLADLLQLVPGTLSNYYGIMDPRVPAATGILTLANLNMPANLICSSLYSLGGTDEMCAQALGPLLKYFKLNPPPIGVVTPVDGGGPPGSVVEPEDARTSSSRTAATDDADLIGQLTSMLGESR